MQNRVYTFSVVRNDKENYALVERLKQKCKARGQSFSWVVIQALKQYEDATNV